LADNWCTALAVNFGIFHFLSTDDCFGGSNMHSQYPRNTYVSQLHMFDF